jgi:hypothetical protein
MQCTCLHLSPKKEGAPSPLERFTGVGVRPKLSSFHPFGYPVYVLDSTLASGKSLPKWEDRVHIDIYLGPLLSHSSLVAMILSLTHHGTRVVILFLMTAGLIGCLFGALNAYRNRSFLCLHRLHAIALGSPSSLRTH